MRQQQGLSLHQVEQRSGGTWKAVVVGSYERAHRHVTAARLAELASFYGVAVSQLLPGPAPIVKERHRRTLRLNLGRLSSLADSDDRARPLVRYARTIQEQRADYNGRVLTLRERDLTALATVYDCSPDAFAAELVDWGVSLEGTDATM